MNFSLRIFLLACLIFGTLTQDFDLFDALDDDPTPAPEKPKDPSGDPSGGLDFGPGPAKATPKPTPKKPTGGDSGFDLNDAVGPDPNPKPKEPVKPPQGTGGGGDFGINDLLDVNDGSYEPDGGKSRIRDQDPNDPADEPQAEAGTGQIAGIASAVGMAILGAASSYFAYQKKKLCFKIQGGVDPESGKGQRGTQSDPQVFSNLLRSS